VSDELVEVRRWVGSIADTLGLRNYTFEIEVAPLAAGVHATCECVTGRSYARIRVSEDFFDLDERTKAEALIHEVLHPLFHPLMVHVDDLRRELSRSHHEALTRVFERDLESAVDTLATALAPLLGRPAPMSRSG
jgi:hypothetical protein